MIEWPTLPSPGASHSVAVFPMPVRLATKPSACRHCINVIE